MTNAKFLTTFYLLGIVGLFFYSFTQIDLGLTVSRMIWIKDIQTAFQYIGYFNRPLSAYLFIGIILFLYLTYVGILFAIKKFSLKHIWMLIIMTSVLSALAYNAFSYDLFNYIFDAKIISYYQQNPYEHKALDFPNDPMLSFMHWTHRVYPYGPVWLFLTAPLSYMGMQYFLMTFFLFKALVLGCFLGTVWFLGKISKLVFPKYETLTIAFFALNPFVLIESLISAHNDIAMIFFMMGGIYYLVRKNFIFSFLALTIAYGVKFASASFPLPVHIGIIFAFATGVYIFSKLQKKLSWEIVFTLAGCLMILPVIFASLRTNFQPWYILGILPFAALVSRKFYVFIPAVTISFFALGEYVPYLYLGNWDPPVPAYLLWIRICGISLAVTASLLWFFFQRKAKNDTILSL